MTITPTPLTISQLFSSSNEQFLIPAYQRRYSWGRLQLAELFDDVDSLKESDSHLLGSIVCLTFSHVAGINKLELVDGQQRVTSLCVLLKAMHDRYLKIGEDEIAKEIDSLLHCSGIDRKQKPKVELGDLDDPDYTKLMKLEDVNKIVNKNLLNAYNTFGGFIGEFGRDEINQFYYKLRNNVTVIRLDVAQAKDAYKLFETINDRGLKLSPTDIIKNFLLGHASLISEDVLRKTKESWRELIVNLDGFDTDDFFRQFMAGVLKKKVTLSKLTIELKSHYIKTVKEAESLPEYPIYSKMDVEEEEDVRDELPISEESEESGESEVKPSQEKVKKISIVHHSKLLSETSLLYSKLRKHDFKRKKIDRHLTNLQRIKSFPAYIFLLNLFQRNVPEREKAAILEMLETFMLRRHVCAYRTGELDDIFSSMTSIADDDIETTVRAILRKGLPPDSEFEAKFAKHDYRGNENRAKYVLECFEYDSIGDQGEYVLESGAELHLEHIIPQTISTKKAKKEFGDWVTYLGKNAIEQHKEYVNTIGNLTLLGQKLNIVASNNPFQAKLVEYRKSNISITKEIVRRFAEFGFAELKNRANESAKRALKIWKL